MLSPDLQLELERMQRTLRADTSSIFILDGSLLRGIGEWDWTRTSFDVDVADWPIVEATIASERARYLTRGTTSGLEAGWFETNGIESSLCVPLTTDDGTCSGVLFFDYERVRMPPRASILRAERFARECATTLQNAA